MKKPLFSMKDLRVSFFTPAGEVQAVGGISYNLNQGEVMGIVGESGSGKSVEAFTIMGLLQNTAQVLGGEIIFKGENLLDYSEEEMREIRGNEISMIFQNPMTSLNPVYTVGNQLMEVLYAHKDISKEDAYIKAVDMLKKVGISNPEHRMKQYPHEFSGGMRQRVMIAMGLICEPKLLIADEPTTALDVTIQSQIIELIKSLQKDQDMSIIFITHNLGVVADICQKVSVMYAGEIVEQASVDEIFYNPKHPYTQGLLRSMPRVDLEHYERLIPIEGTPIDMLNPPKGCRFAPRCKHAMKVCFNYSPGYTEVGQDHLASCWLLQEEAIANGEKPILRPIFINEEDKKNISEGGI